MRSSSGKRPSLCRGILDFLSLKQRNSSWQLQEKCSLEVNKRRRLNCKGGWTLGICGCCKVCAKLEGEECGGQHNYLGKCDKGLVCEPQEPKFVSFFRNGTKTVYKNPRGICSARDNAEIFQDCQGLCQHTSCRACRFVDPFQACKKCKKDDFKCIREFGRACIRKDACKNAKRISMRKVSLQKNWKESFNAKFQHANLKTMSKSKNNDHGLTFNASY
ncbi:IGFBP N-terminal domain-containing protein [Caerostris extrusa]|uniref:IGFBP N-terminal domain-containing protein n=1 Tax=Caerostris extrusa TaxID=172846 RepID=A0AAV4VVY0_CAEEX|nr:IGFBP N-terminal domain-containing protein [Caerostris extrusa]